MYLGFKSDDTKYTPAQKISPKNLHRRILARQKRIQRQTMSSPITRQVEKKIEINQKKSRVGKPQKTGRPKSVTLFTRFRTYLLSPHFKMTLTGFEGEGGKGFDYIDCHLHLLPQATQAQDASFHLIRRYWQGVVKPFPTTPTFFVTLVHLVMGKLDYISLFFLVCSSQKEEKFTLCYNHQYRTTVPSDQSYIRNAIGCLSGVTFNIGVEILTSFHWVAFLLLNSPY